MIEESVIEKMYQEQLEEDIILYLAKVRNIGLDDAMEIYYKSKLADKIAQGKYGIQYLDYKVLVNILQETEPEIFQ